MVDRYKTSDFFGIANFGIAMLPSRPISKAGLDVRPSVRSSTIFFLVVFGVDIGKPRGR